MSQVWGEKCQDITGKKEVNITNPPVKSPSSHIHSLITELYLCTYLDNYMFTCLVSPRSQAGVCSMLCSLSAQNSAIFTCGCISTIC